MSQDLTIEIIVEVPVSVTVAVDPGDPSQGLAPTYDIRRVYDDLAVKAFKAQIEKQVETPSIIWDAIEAAAPKG